MNYSCIPDVGYFDSPDFLSLALHTNTIISIPIHSFGFYCILLKTPQQMRPAMWYLVNLHTWVVLFDISYSFLTVPFLLVPHFAGHPLGVLRYFGVSTHNQIVMVFVFLANMLVSICMVFENRFHTLCTFNGKHHWTRWRRVWIVGFHIAACLCFFSWYLFVPDQLIAKRNMFQKLPCLPQNIYEADNYVLTEEIIYPLSISVFFFIVFSSKTLFFTFFLIWNTMSQLKNRTLSRKTYSIQKAFLVAMGIQITIPSILFAIPALYAWRSFVYEYYNQAWNNIMVTLLSIHGFMSSLSMIFAHKPYRAALLECFKRRRNQSEEQSLKVLNYQKNASVGPVEN
ncbi:hypothetical protein CAEBREN_07140 [Caenorhabditis brenneri]|uniref:Serpentine Receptor, class H n=1 Tax=Caenorhabditis brenneri TaxID=135651 RepID=G0MU60_CAEBE|nr:hypothetical protein CAEBREN_07140 [Caenorhabditis brenneri]